MSVASTWTETVLRPGGKPYRAKVRPRANGFDSSWNGEGGVVVDRTHDVDVAVALATREWRAYGFDGPLPAPQLCWLRLVPWDHTGEFDSSWENARPSDRGAIPCVVFDERQ